MTYEQIILKIADSPSFETLDTELQSEILAIKKEHDEFLENQEREKEAKNEHLEKEKAKKRQKLLCIGQWGEKVPFKRRFVLCHQSNVYSTYSGGPNERTERREDYCAVDLVRGYMSPYFGYFGTSTDQWKMDAFYNERIRPILEAKDEKELLDFLESEWNFFKINDTHRGEKFHVLDYDVEKDTGHPWAYAKVADKVIVKGESPLMTWEQHRDALRKEFDE